LPNESSASEFSLKHIVAGIEVPLRLTCLSSQALQNVSSDKKKKRYRLTRLFAFVFFFSSYAALAALLGVTFIGAIFSEFNRAGSQAIARGRICGACKRVFFFHEHSNYHILAFVLREQHL